MSPATDPSGSIEGFAAMRKALRDAVKRSDRRGRAGKGSRGSNVRYFCVEHGFVQPADDTDDRCSECGAPTSRVGSANP